MKTNSAARRVWRLRLTIGYVAIAVLASFDLWAGGYCYRNLAKSSTQYTHPQPVWYGSVTGSEIFSGVR